MKININNLRRVFLITVVVILGNGIGTAQPGRGQDGPPPLPNDKQIKEMVADLSIELSLTPDKEVMISNMYFEHFEALETEMKSHQSMSPQEMDAKDIELESEVKDELTKDQKKLYTAWLKSQEKQRGPQGGMQGPLM